MNNTTMIGRMTAEPNLRMVDIKDGKGQTTPVIDFYIAVDDNFGEYKKTDFVHVTAWRGAAKMIAEYMSKGREIAVKGAVHLGSYKTKNGEIRYHLDMPRPDGFEFLGKRVNNETTETDPEEEATPFEV